jgi:hypothetical protein
MIQDAQLGEHRGLIPIEMLVGHLTGLKLNNAHPGGLDLSTRTGTPSISNPCPAYK